MRADSFLDTNVLVYAVSGDPREAAKAARALDLIDTADFGISGQVLQEFYVTVVRKIAVPLRAGGSARMGRTVRDVPLPPSRRRYRTTRCGDQRAVPDQLLGRAIVAAAQSLGARTLFTEDLNHGQDYGGVRVVDPFLSP